MTTILENETMTKLDEIQYTVVNDNIYYTAPVVTDCLFLCSGSCEGSCSGKCAGGCYGNCQSSCEGHSK